jgi:hypothetical protein
LGYGLGIVGNNDFIFCGDISHFGYNKKQGGAGACDKNKGFFFWRKDDPLLPHYEQLLFEVTIFRQCFVACCQTIA